MARKGFLAIPDLTGPASCHTPGMAIKRLPRPRDPIALAKLIGDIATGQVVDAVDDGKCHSFRSVVEWHQPRRRLAGADHRIEADCAALDGSAHAQKRRPWRK